MKKFFCLLCFLFVLAIPVQASANSIGISLEVTKFNSDMSEFNNYVKSDISVPFKNDGMRLSTAVYYGLKNIQKLTLSAGIGASFLQTVKSSLLSNKKLTLLTLSAFLSIDYDLVNINWFSLALGITGGVSRLGYLKSSLLKLDNQWRNYYDLEPHISASFNIGSRLMVKVTGGYHFRSAISEWTEKSKELHSWSNVLSSMNFWFVSIGLGFNF